jgi:hypothetical protein
MKNSRVSTYFWLLGAVMFLVLSLTYGVSMSLSGTRPLNDICMALSFMFGAITFSYGAYVDIYHHAKSTRSMEIVQGVLWIGFALSLVPLMFVGTQNLNPAWLTLTVIGSNLAAGVYNLGMK